MTGTQDHYQIFIATSGLKGLSRINQHKSVMDVFDVELKSGEIHAMTIKTQVLE
jgi:stress-induced morphogen